ncbi:hypothetical protein A2W14_02895 [Candidatus Gottesmanbacteria bacterium RBG_16_37_8]|uniref:DUF5681 domain-containing protein n=1 Tax=Candidatus Gottesmanbacteria bacterium RBG_16_37_8 TaxID=1798371 RepID=A0A1F5YT94_9BACT|nr:MAG: hypothetical protein A2W14_02895 [Candidatus Gottesmanbacteria bacterium RBG_16_37_8]
MHSPFLRFFYEEQTKVQTKNCCKAMPGGRGKLTGRDGKPFVKGDPRINRKGRPPKLPDLQELLARVLSEQKEKKTAMELILLTLKEKALKGDLRAGEMLKDWAYGKAKQVQEVDVTLEKLEKLDDESLTALCNKLIEKQNG